MSKVKRSGTVVDELVAALRERIMSADLAPGVRLSQAHLAEEMKVSRTPLREALQRLSTEGLVVGEANRGMEVSPVSLAAVEDSYAMRLLVEPATVAGITAAVTDEDVRRMVVALDAMESPGCSTRDFQTAHICFHQVLLDRYPLAFSALIESLHARIERAQRLYFARPRGIAEFTEVDRQFLQAVVDREHERIRQILEFHLVDAALGLVLEVDPDFRFDKLALSLAGIGIQVEGIGSGLMDRPARITWRRSPCALPRLATSSLIHEPSAC
ncbi:MAG: GntR family transcriptional regulator [Marmoricola sp.]